MSNRAVGQPRQRCSGYDVPNYYDGCNFGSVEEYRVRGNRRAARPGSGEKCTRIGNDPYAKSGWGKGLEVVEIMKRRKMEYCMYRRRNGEHGRWRRDTR